LLRFRVSLKKDENDLFSSMVVSGCLLLQMYGYQTPGGPLLVQNLFKILKITFALSFFRKLKTVIKRSEKGF
jgi:hypothetical protein